MRHAVVISDLHLGSPYCRTAALQEFLGGLDSETVLIMNGDVTSIRRGKPLPPAHRALLDQIVARSRSSRVVWVTGNNDPTPPLSADGAIEVCCEYRLGRRLYVVHGHRFSRILSLLQPTLFPVRGIHNGLSKLGLVRSHQSQMAQHFPGVYGIICADMRKRALRYARKQGFGAITCGHVHHSEDVTEDGVRYINTGAWTGNDAAWLDVRDDSMKLHLDAQR